MALDGTQLSRIGGAVFGSGLAYPSFATAGTTTIYVSEGSLSIAGQSAVVDYSIQIPVSGGTLSVTGQTVTVDTTRYITITNATLATTPRLGVVVDAIHSTPDRETLVKLVITSLIGPLIKEI